MADRGERSPAERDSPHPPDYKESRRDKAYYASRDYEKDFPPREYPPARDYTRSNGENKIYVGGLPYAATKDDLYDHFSKAGKVVHVQLVVDQETQRSKGYAFITFADEDAYLYALKKMDGSSILGRNVKVNKALNPEEKAAWEREHGIVRDRDGRHRPNYNSDRPHFEKPPGPKAKGYRVIITGLPESYTWRELKDFLRTTTTAQPTYANIERAGHGYLDLGGCLVCG